MRPVSDIIERLRPPALPEGWSWHTYRGVLVIRHNGVSVGWVALSDHVPFTAQLANRIVRDLAADA